MFVQDIEVLRKTANRSIIDQVTARDLEAIGRQNRIEQMIERAFEQARSVAQRVKSVVQRRHELIRELRFRKQQAKARKIERKRSRGPSMSPA
jgi:ribosome maturation protein Sdo1